MHGVVGALMHVNCGVRCCPAKGCRSVTVRWHGLSAIAAGNPCRQTRERDALGEGVAFSRVDSVDDRVEFHLTTMLPFISDACPGQVQKKLYATPGLSAATLNVVEAVSPPPMSLVLATTRSSFGLT